MAKISDKEATKKTGWARIYDKFDAKLSLDEMEKDGIYHLWPFKRMKIPLNLQTTDPDARIQKLNLLVTGFKDWPSSGFKPEFYTIRDIFSNIFVNKTCSSITLYGVEMKKSSEMPTLELDFPHQKVR